MSDEIPDSLRGRLAGPERAYCRECGNLGPREGPCVTPWCPTHKAVSPLALPTESISATGKGLIYVRGDEVVFDVPNLGMMQLPPDVAEMCGKGLLAAAKIARAAKPSGPIVRVTE
jgi:hypothetical protein